MNVQFITGFPRSRKILENRGKSWNSPGILNFYTLMSFAFLFGKTEKCVVSVYTFDTQTLTVRRTLNILHIKVVGGGGGSLLLYKMGIDQAAVVVEAVQF